MCGIVGIVQATGAPSGIDPAIGDRMRDRMAARGPDDAGHHLSPGLYFGHRRLAIRDVAAGKQPWLSDDGACVLTYNGELYNDHELRRELTDLGVQFRTRCDTETLMAAYRQWGAGCVDRLRGMFAFGIFDDRDDSLLLVRDRCGVKPLYFTELDGHVIFASTIDAILAHPGVPRRPNVSTISHYLTTFRTTLARETMYERIWQLLPGEMLRLRGGRIQITRYWSLPNDDAPPIDFEEATSLLEQTLCDAVSRRLVSDRPVGMMLSGGVDSSTIACLLRDRGIGSFTARCGGAPDSDDATHAALCASHVGCDFDHVPVDAEQYRDSWENILGATREPLSTPSDVVIYNVALALKKHVAVVLGGEGADELLCGYEAQHWAGTDYELASVLGTPRWQAPPQLAEQFRMSLQRCYGRDVFRSPAEHYFALNSLIPTNVKPALLNDDCWKRAGCDEPMLSIYETLFHDRQHLGGLRATQNVLQQVNLESLLKRLDQTTMLAGLEARVPFADHLLIEQMARVPIRHFIRIRPGERYPYRAAAELQSAGALESKRPLRELADRLMPRVLSRRKKASFPTSVQQFLTGSWSSWVGRTISGSPFMRQLFRPDALRQVVAPGQTSPLWLWPLMNLALWGDREFC